MYEGMAIFFLETTRVPRDDSQDGQEISLGRARYSNAKYPDKRFCYLLHDYLRGVGTLACASSSLNYRLILLVFWNVEVTRTPSSRASWVENVSVGFRVRSDFDRSRDLFPPHLRDLHSAPLSRAIGRF